MSKDFQTEHKTGVTEKENNQYAYFDDVYLNSKHDMTLDVSSNMTKVELSNNTGETVSAFSIVSLVPSGRCDVRFENLSPSRWYRLKLNGKLAEAGSGRAHTLSKNTGEVNFDSVIIPSN